MITVLAALYAYVSQEDQIRARQELLETLAEQAEEREKREAALAQQRKQRDNVTLPVLASSKANDGARCARN